MKLGGHLTERMVDVAHGRRTWSTKEAAHLRACAECAAEWHLTVGAAGIGRGMKLDAERVATAVVERLDVPRPRAPSASTYRWVVGLAAAAAIVIATLPAGPRQVPVSRAGASTVLSELDGLTPEELLTVLDVLDPLPATAGADPDAARLGDLTTGELERVLRSLEG